jgi:hydroxybutyrate-dimer hydrolase
MSVLAKRVVSLAAAASLAAGIGVLAGETAETDETKIIHTHYDGVTNDLLTAGLGKTGLGGSTPPGFADPLHPTAEELVTATEGLIPGDEYIAYERGGQGRVTMMVQVPDSFDPGNSCIVAAPSSGSRGVYGAIATAGEWGLKHGCAVAYTDKGTGTGAHNLQNNTINLIRGERADASSATRGNFIAPISESQRAPSTTPRQTGLLSSMRIRKPTGRRPARRRAPTRRRLIDGLAVGEPNVNPKFSSDFSIVQGNGPPLLAHSRPLMNYITVVNVFQGCANLAPANAGAGLNSAGSPARCAHLHAKGLLSSTTLVDQAAEAQKIINDFGILPEQNLVQPGYWFANVPQSISVAYANTYGRFSVLDNLCGYSFAANAGVPGGAPVPLAAAAEAAIFGTSSGIPPTSGMALINNAAPGGSKEDRGSTPNQNLDGALCLRSLATGKDAVTGAPLGGSQQAQASRIAAGVEEVLATGKLRRIPAVFVTGRNDGILPPNFTSRAYFDLNKVVEGSASSLHYYEITNAHHLDTLNQFPGYSANYVPLHRYYIQAMDLMYDHLRHGRPLPPSQVVHAIPRGPGAPLPPPITPANVPPIGEAPPPVTFAAGQVKIPD